MSLSEQDRGDLIRSLIGPEYAMSATRASSIAAALSESDWLDQYVARHVRAALTEAAERIEPGGTGPLNLPEHWSAIERPSFLSGMDHAARIVRNLADSTSSPLTSP